MKAHFLGEDCEVMFGHYGNDRALDRTHVREWMGANGMCYGQRSGDSRP